MVKARPDYVENAAPCPGGPRDTRHINCHSWMALVKAADHTPLSRPIKSQPLSIKNQSSTIHKPKPHTQHQQQISPQFPTTASSHTPSKILLPFPASFAYNHPPYSRRPSLFYSSVTVSRLIEGRDVPVSCHVDKESQCRRFVVIQICIRAPGDETRVFYLYLL